MSKGCTPHFNDIVAARGGSGASGPGTPGFMAPGTAGAQQRGQTGKQHPPTGDAGMKSGMMKPPSVAVKHSGGKSGKAI
jgi:hypothetical protein